MNYFERLTAEIETRKNQMQTLKTVGAEYAAGMIAKEIHALSTELERYQKYEAIKEHNIYHCADN